MTIKPRIIGYRRSGCPIWAIQGGSEPVVEPGANPNDPPAGPGNTDGDKPLGPNGEKALNAEREARQRVETELKEFKAAQAEQAKKIAEAFGIKTEGAKPEDAVATALQEVSGLKRDLLVERLARQNEITDEDDLTLLRLAGDEAAMTKLAARLKPAAKEPEAGRRAPRPDPSQGKGGTDPKPGEAGKAEAARRFQKTTTQQ